MIIPLLVILFGANIPHMNYIPMSFLSITIIPSLSVTVRRLYDSGRSGWWVLFAMIIPFFGILLLFIFTLYDSEAATNKWGRNPKLYPNWK